MSVPADRLLALPSVGEVWDRVLTATADTYAATAACDERWADNAVASAVESGVHLQAALFWSWLLTHESRNPTIRFVDRTEPWREIPRCAYLVAQLQDAHGSDADWRVLEVVRRLQAVHANDPRLFDSLFLTLAASGWASYNSRNGPLPGGPAGVGAHVLGWGRRSMEARRWFLSHHLQTGLRLILVGEAAAAVVGVPVDACGHHPDLVARLTSLILGGLREGGQSRLWRWPKEAGEFLRLAAAMVALEVPWLASASQWIPHNSQHPALFLETPAAPCDVQARGTDGAEIVLSLDCGLAAGETLPERCWQHTVMRLARLVALDDGEGFEDLLAVVAADPARECLAAGAAVDVLITLARGAEEAVLARP